MLKKIWNLLKQLLWDEYNLFFVGSSDKLPEPLSREEETKYVELSMQGDEQARAKLIEHNLRLVVFLSKKYENTGIDLEDLVSIGTIGLIKGVDSYSYKKGTRITTYCARCIENEILMYFRSDKKNSKNVSINEGIGFDKDGNEITFLDILKTPKPDFALDLYKQTNMKLLKKYFDVLTPREREIVIKRYGLNNQKETTQKEIAKELGISRSYVSRIEKRALTKLLREFMKEKKI